MEHFLKVAFMGLPKSMGVVLLSVDDQVASPTIGACVIVKEAKERMGRSDWPIREVL